MFNKLDSREKTRNESMEIYTLGRFQVRFDGQTLFAESTRSQKIGELFMYLITNRGKPSAPEAIVEAIWPEQEYVNPKNALKILIHRLKQKLDASNVPQARFSITCSYGCYDWNHDMPHWLDTDAFEIYSQQARDLAKTDPHHALEKYRKALLLYRGDYLPECRYSDWVLPIRHYYRRLFVRTVSELLELQKEHRLFTSMAADCERALFIEHLDEELHLRYLEALLAEGKVSQARAHYEHITAYIYRELGVKPSPEMRRIYRAIKSHGEKTSLEFNDLQQMIQERDNAGGALLCEPDYFQFACRMERRRATRQGTPIHMGLLALTGSDYRLPPPSQLQQCMAWLQQLLLVSLRKGDVITSWNENQFALLLPGLDREAAESVLQRLRSSFQKECPGEDVVLRSSVYPVLPHEYS